MHLDITADIRTYQWKEFLPFSFYKALHNHRGGSIHNAIRISAACEREGFTC